MHVTCTRNHYFTGPFTKKMHTQISLQTNLYPMKTLVASARFNMSAVTLDLTPRRSQHMYSRAFNTSQNPLKHASLLQAHTCSAMLNKDHEIACQTNADPTAHVLEQQCNFVNLCSFCVGRHPQRFTKTRAHNPENPCPNHSQRRLQI